MWSVLCGWGSLCQRCCRRTEFLHCDPQTLLFCCWWASQRDQSLSYCARMSNWRECRTNSRTDHYIQTHSHNLLPSCWCSYMTLISPHFHLHSTQSPVTASTHTLSTQHLPPLIKSVWMIRIQLICVSVSSCSVSLRQTEEFIHCVQIQSQKPAIWWR